MAKTIFSKNIRSPAVSAVVKIVIGTVVLCSVASCVNGQYHGNYTANEILDQNIGYTNGQRSLRSSRLFPLFTIIRFTNEVCRTTSEEGGICHTKKQCILNGGSAQGTCAQGLGVCCQFIANCGSTVTQNGTMIRNPNYPSAYQLNGGTNVCQVRIRKPLNACQVRLNFNKFDIDGPTAPPSTTATNPQEVGVCKTDQLTVTSSGATVPQLCGNLAGQHMYVDFGSSDTITINLVISGNVQRDRTWEIEVLYIPCNSVSRAPSGCLQYFTGVSGTVQSFNTIQGTGQHLANQDYSICVRMEDGMRSIEWTGCTAGSVRISGPTTNTAPPTGPVTRPTAPTPLNDYLIIPGGIQSPYPPATGTMPTLPISDTDRFFDAYFIAGGSGVRSYVKPFIMHFRTDGTEQQPMQDASNGFCLNWQQSPN